MKDVHENTVTVTFENKWVSSHDNNGDNPFLPLPQEMTHLSSISTFNGLNNYVLLINIHITDYDRTFMDYYSV